MANSEKQEHALTLGGKDYTFHLGVEALIALQERLAEHTPTGIKVLPIDEILRQINAGRLKYTRALVWAALREFHPDLSEKDVSKLLDDANEQEMLDLLKKLGLSTQPDPKDVKALGVSDNGNPPPARRGARRQPHKPGTGGNSTSRPAVSG